MTEDATTEQIAWLAPKRVRAVVEWWTRRGWRARLFGRVGYRRELVEPDGVCPCSRQDECGGFDGSAECLCEGYDYCLGGTPHTAMGEG